MQRLGRWAQRRALGQPSIPPPHPRALLPPCSNGEAGDLYVFISVKAHPELRRDGVTIHSGARPPGCWWGADGAGAGGWRVQEAQQSGGRRGRAARGAPLPAHDRCAAPRRPAPGADVEISYVDAILGTTVKVTTLGSDGLGEVDLKIPAGTQPGTTLVMSKRGVPKLGQSGARGDHLVHVKVRGRRWLALQTGPLGLGALRRTFLHPGPTPHARTSGWLPLADLLHREPAPTPHPPSSRHCRRSRSPSRSAARSASSWSSCASCRRPSRRPAAAGGAGSRERPPGKPPLRGGVAA